MAAFNRQPNVLFLLPQSHASPVNRPQRYGKWRFTVRHAIPLPSGALLSVLFHESARGKWTRRSDSLFLDGTGSGASGRLFPRVLGTRRVCWQNSSNRPRRRYLSGNYSRRYLSPGCHLGRTLAAEIWASVFFPVTGLFLFCGFEATGNGRDVCRQNSVDRPRPSAREISPTGAWSGHQDNRSRRIIRRVICRLVGR